MLSDHLLRRDLRRPVLQPRERNPAGGGRFQAAAVFSDPVGAGEHRAGPPVCPFLRHGRGRRRLRHRTFPGSVGDPDYGHTDQGKEHVWHPVAGASGGPGIAEADSEAGAAQQHSVGDHRLFQRVCPVLHQPKMKKNWALHFHHYFPDIVVQ